MTPNHIQFLSYVISNINGDHYTSAFTTDTINTLVPASIKGRKREEDVYGENIILLFVYSRLSIVKYVF